MLVGLTVLLVLLGLVFLGWGGTYFASEIDAAALTVQPASDEANQTAVEVSRDSITLDVDDAGQGREELGSDGVFGIQAGTAYGQVFGSTTGPGGRITRDFRMLIEADGPGYETAAIAGRGEAHVVFHIMRARAAAIGAHLTLEGEPGRGARVALWLCASERQAA